MAGCFGVTPMEFPYAEKVDNNICVTIHVPKGGSYISKMEINDGSTNMRVPSYFFRIVAQAGNYLSEADRNLVTELDDSILLLNRSTNDQVEVKLGPNVMVIPWNTFLNMGYMEKRVENIRRYLEDRCQDKIWNTITSEIIDKNVFTLKLAAPAVIHYMFCEIVRNKLGKEVCTSITSAESDENWRRMFCMPGTELDFYLNRAAIWFDVRNSKKIKCYLMKMKGYEGAYTGPDGIKGILKDTENTAAIKCETRRFFGLVSNRYTHMPSKLESDIADAYGQVVCKMICPCYYKVN